MTSLLAIAQSNDYETVDDYLADAALAIMSRVTEQGGRISKEDALQFLKDSGGDTDDAIWNLFND